jgi:hypothetical protein
VQYVDYSIFVAISQLTSVPLVISLLLVDNKAIAHVVQNHMIYYKSEEARYVLDAAIGKGLYISSILSPRSIRAAIWQCTNSYAGLFSSEGSEHRNQKRVMVCVAGLILAHFLTDSSHYHSCLHLVLAICEIYSPFSMRNLPRSVVVPHEVHQTRP